MTSQTALFDLLVAGRAFNANKEFHSLRSEFHNEPDAIGSRPTYADRKGRLSPSAPDPILFCEPWTLSILNIPCPAGVTSPRRLG